MMTLVTIACSGATSSTDPQSAPTAGCIKPRTTYRATWVEQSGGTCGVIEATVFSTLPDGKRKPGASACSGTIAENGCTETISSYSCNADGTYAETQSGTMTWTADGIDATGTIDVSRSGRLTCQSSYAVSFARE